MDSDRDEIRREVLAELIELARTQAMQHRTQKGDAERHGADDIQLQAECLPQSREPFQPVSRAPANDPRPAMPASISTDNPSENAQARSSSLV